MTYTFGTLSDHDTGLKLNMPISVLRCPRRALTLCLQLRMGIQPCARFPARGADALPETLYGHFTQAIYRNRPIQQHSRHASMIGRCVRTTDTDAVGRKRLVE